MLELADDRGRVVCLNLDKSVTVRQGEDSRVLDYLARAIHPSEGGDEFDICSEEEDVQVYS